jgi:zinc transport system substrate-binding protein
MIWEGEPLQKSVAKLKEMGIESVVFDPCGNRPDSGDFISVMKANVGNLKRVFGEQ